MRKWMEVSLPNSTVAVCMEILVRLFVYSRACMLFGWTFLKYSIELLSGFHSWFEMLLKWDFAHVKLAYLPRDSSPKILIP